MPIDDRRARSLSTWDLSEESFGFVEVTPEDLPERIERKHPRCGASSKVSAVCPHREGDRDAVDTRDQRQPGVVVRDGEKEADAPAQPND